MIRAVLFDAGNTLIHAEPSIAAIYQEIARDFGADVDQDVIKSAFNKVWNEHVKVSDRWHTRCSDKDDREMWRQITFSLHTQIPAMHVFEHSAWFERLYDVLGEPSRWRLYPDTLAALGQLRSQNIKIGLVSNWDGRLRKILAGLGLTGLLDSIVISSEVGYRKPRIEIFRSALLQLGAKPHEAVHVGDVYEDDYLGASNAGLTPILIDRDGRQPSAHANTIHDLSEITRFIT